MKVTPKPAPESPLVGHGLQKPMSGTSRLEKMEQLAVDTEIVRGITLRESLRSFGRLWRWSPLDLREEDRKKLWQRSKQVPGFDTFLSHTWLTAGRWKVLTLLVRSGWHMMLVGWFFGVLVAMLLCLVDILPMPVPWLVETVGFTKVCQLSWWILILGTTSSLLGLLGSVYVPNSVSRSEVCFLDVVSIHQTDAQLMERGIYGLGGFLKVAKELRVLWSPPYLSRLWCVFELAAYRTANPEGKITLNPLFIESLCGIMFLGNLAGSVLYTTMQLRKMSQSYTIGSYMMGMLPLLAAVHVLRREVQLRRHLALGLSNFKLSEAECRNDFDREFIYSGIIQWYGSLEAFTAYVRKSLRMELIGCAYFQLRIPPGYLLLICIGPVSASLEGFLALLKGEAPAEVLMRYLIGRVLATDLCWQLFALKLMLTLCDTLGARPWPGLLNCVKSLLIFMVFCACSIVGGAIGEVTWTRSLVGCIIWLGCNGLLILAMIGMKKCVHMKLECYMKEDVEQPIDGSPIGSPIDSPRPSNDR